MLSDRRNCRKEKLYQSIGCDLSKDCIMKRTVRITLCDDETVEFRKVEGAMNTVLVVDDSVLMRDMIKALLSSGGYEIAGEASDGQEAYEKYKLLRPDITIMDIMMDRVDGIQSLEMIREYDPNAAVVICSSMDQENYVMKALRLGAKEFIIKPFSSDDVLGAVLRALQ